MQGLVADASAHNFDNPAYRPRLSDRVAGIVSTTNTVVNISVERRQMKGVKACNRRVENILERLIAAKTTDALVMWIW